MIQGHYGLTEDPFSIAPDPRFFFLSQRHREGLAHLVYGVSKGGGFILLTGEVGTGKTLLCRCLLQQLPENVRLAFVLNPRLSPVELLQTLCDELRIALPDARTSLKALTDAITERLLEHHRRGLSTVLLIDEAQQLPDESLEQVRLLTNLETDQKKLLQIILVGQPELLDKLAQGHLRQLAQRITARYHLLPLSAEDTGAYVKHRLHTAGAKSLPFSTGAIRALHKVSGGIPRLINTVSDRALLGAYARQLALIDRGVIEKAGREVLGSPRPGNTRTGVGWRVAAGILVPLGLGLGIGFGKSTWLGFSGQPEAVAQATPPALPEATPPSAPAETPASPTLAAPALAPASSAPDSAALIAALLNDQAPDEDGQRAATALLGHWQLRAPEGEPACEFAPSAGLRCEAMRLQWPEVLTQNTPVSLELQKPDGSRFWVNLLRVEGEKLHLQSAGRSLAVWPHARLLQLWTGETRWLWRPPRDYQRPLLIGSSGPAVIAVASLLNEVGGESTPASGQFNAQLGERLKAFQHQHGLPEDGIAGAQTLTALQALSAAPQPRLQERSASPY